MQNEIHLVFLKNELFLKVQTLFFRLRKLCYGKNRCVYYLFYLHAIFCGTTRVKIQSKYWHSWLGLTRFYVFVAFSQKKKELFDESFSKLVKTLVHKVKGEWVSFISKNSNTHPSIKVPINLSFRRINIYILTLVLII